MRELPRVVPHLIVVAALAAAGCDRGTPRLDVPVVEARLSPMLNGAAAIFGEIRNRGDGKDVLVAAQVDVPGAIAELHEIADGRMVKAEAIPVPANGVLALRPGGLHVMVFHLPRGVAPGAELPLRLSFRRSGELRVAARIRERETSGANVVPDGGLRGRRGGAQP